MISKLTGPRRFPWKIFSRLAYVQASIILLALASSGIAAHVFFKREFVSQIELQLRHTLTGYAHFLPAEVSDQWCVDIAQGTDQRITFIGSDGGVICDSHHDPRSMDNHLYRPEIVEALKNGFGQSLRMSDTLDQAMLYEAIVVKGGHYLRGAIPLAAVESTMRVFDTSVAIIFLLIAIVLAVFALYSGHQLVYPMTKLLENIGHAVTSEPGHRDELGRASFGEWTELEDSIDQIRKDLASKVESLVMERQQLSTLMASISDAILAVDKQGLPLFFNSRFAILFGREALQGKPRLFEIFRQPEILEAFKKTLNEGNASTVNSLKIEHSSHSYYFSLSIAPLIGSRDEVYGAVGIFHDITELKSAEQMRIDFVANVSHELRTPLTSIKGFADTVISDAKNGKPVDPEFVEVIARNSDRLITLIQDLLDLSSIESAVVLQKDEVDTAEISSRVVSQLRGALERKHQSIVLRFGAPTVCADPRRLEQVLINLLDNASKYSPQGAQIEMTWEAAADGATLLKVKDTGPGIAPEHHARLFERFYRVDKGRSRDLGGTGLGLSIVKHIMQRHGGSVSVQSALGSGATFTCKFPAGNANGVRTEGPRST